MCKSVARPLVSAQSSKALPLFLADSASRRLDRERELEKIQLNPAIAATNPLLAAGRRGLANRMQRASAMALGNSGGSGGGMEALLAPDRSGSGSLLRRMSALVLSGAVGRRTLFHPVSFSERLFLFALFVGPDAQGKRAPADQTTDLRALPPSAGQTPRQGGGSLARRSLSAQSVIKAVEDRRRVEVELEAAAGKGAFLSQPRTVHGRALGINRRSMSANSMVPPPAPDAEQGPPGAQAAGQDKAEPEARRHRRTKSNVDFASMALAEEAPAPPSAVEVGSSWSRPPLSRQITLVGEDGALLRSVDRTPRSPVTPTDPPLRPGVMPSPQRQRPMSPLGLGSYGPPQRSPQPSPRTVRL